MLAMHRCRVKEKVREFAARECHASRFYLRVFAKDDLSGVGIHRFEDCERLQVIALLAQLVAAVLEALLHRHTDAHQLGAGLLHDVHQAAHGVAVGHKVVDDEDLILGLEPLLGHQQGHFFLIGIGEDLALIQAALDVVALGLLGKEHGNAVLLRADGRKRDAAGLRRQNDRDLAGVEILGELVRNVLEQTGVDAVVEETVHLDDVAGQDSALAADALLKKLHGITPPEKIISDEIFRLKW